MSGHSKWAQIKHKKAVSDVKKGKVFSKISRQISLAAREKGPDPTMNPKLRMAIELAQEANMPKENIGRAIEKAVGKGGEAALEEMMIEAYGPGGAAIIIKAITDSRNRTVAEIRHILSEHGGKFAGEGSVKWLFESSGRILIRESNEEALALAAIDLGAKDVQKENPENGAEKIVVLTAPEELDKVKKGLEAGGFAVIEAGLDLIAKDYINLDQGSKLALEKLFEALDEQEDVQEIYSNVKV